MTHQRWLQISVLFDAALRLAPAERGDWLRAACGQDDELRTEVDHLLDQDAQATRNEFLAPPEGPVPAIDVTDIWPPVVARTGPLGGAGPVAGAHARAEVDVCKPNDLVDESGGFTPRAAIVAGARPTSISEPRAVVRARLRELPIIYILILGMATTWRHTVLDGDQDFSLYVLDTSVIVALAGIVVLLSTRCALSLTWLKTLELGMVAMLASRIAIVQYRLMLEFSSRDDRLMAQLTMKNIVLLTSILILTYGLYVPKSWRRAALVVAPLAMLPFVTLGVLSLQDPQAMSWLWHGHRPRGAPRLWLFTFDATILFILALSATFGARTISRLHRQVAEARQLGQYRLRQRIGAGGMGEVYLAEHQLLKRPSAIKLIRPENMADPIALARFEREVQLTATLSHPNTVDVFDYGRTEDGTYYYVMEYLPGLSLAELVDQYGPVSPGRSVYLLRQVCHALREAHAVGLIHRDVKPSNIFAARRGGLDDVAKLLDFGLVRPASAPLDSHLSNEGQILGTPLFMSPEQARGVRELDGRSDIYSLGAVAYYLLTGRPPFVESDGVGVLIAHARDPVLPPSQLRPDVPEDLERVVLRSLAKEPSDRYPDVEALERALAECACAGDWHAGHASLWWSNVRYG